MTSTTVPNTFTVTGQVHQSTGYPISFQFIMIESLSVVISDERGKGLWEATKAHFAEQGMAVHRFTMFPLDGKVEITFGAERDL